MTVTCLMVFAESTREEFSADASAGSRHGGRRQTGEKKRSLMPPRRVRRVVVMTRIVRHHGSRFRSARLSKHLAYLKRDGVTRELDEVLQTFDRHGARLSPFRRRRARLRRLSSARHAPAGRFAMINDGMGSSSCHGDRRWSRGWVSRCRARCPLAARSTGASSANAGSAYSNLNAPGFHLWD